MSIPCLDNCNARHLCIFKAAHPIHVKFWPMKIIPNIQIKLLLLSKLLPPLCLCPDSLIPREQVRTEYVTIHQIFVDSNHSPMDLLFLVGFFLFVTVNWHPHMQDTHSSLKQMRRSGCFWTVLNSLFFTSMADQPLSSAYSTICKTYVMQEQSHAVVRSPDTDLDFLGFSLPFVGCTTWTSTSSAVKVREQQYLICKIVP